MLKQITQREFKIEEILTNAWDIYSKQFKSFLLIALFIYIPINIALYLVSGKVEVSGKIENLQNFQLYLWCIKLIEVVFGIVATMSIVVIVEKTIFSEDDTGISGREALDRAFSRWGTCVVTNILAISIIIPLVLLFVVPGIIWGLYYVFIVQVVILKNLRNNAALDYSKALVKGRWWKVFKSIFIINFIGFIFAVTISLIFSFIDDAIGIIVKNTIIDIVNIYCVVGTTLYFINLDCLKQKELKFESNNISGHI